MTISLTKYDSVGRPLTKEEVDANWTDIETAVNGALAGALPVAAITLAEGVSGQFLRFLDGDGTPIANVPFPAMLVEGGEWEEFADYTTRHIVTHEGGTYICRTAHTAYDFASDAAAGYWMMLGSNAAQSIAFTPGDTGLDATTMQDAIAELAGMLGSGLTADRVNYDNSTSGLVGTTVEAAINELATRTGAGGEDIHAFDVIVQPVGVIPYPTDLQTAVGMLSSAITGTDAAAADVSITPISGVSASNVQAALEVLKSQIGSASVAASGVSFFPGGLSSEVTTATNVQTAIADLVDYVRELHNRIAALEAA